MDNTLETSIDLYTLFTDKESLETTIDLLCSELLQKIQMTSEENI